MRKSRTLERADALEKDMLDATARAHDGAVAAVIRKHALSLRLIRQLEDKGEYERARMQIRVCGLIDDLARAIASAGQDSAALIRSALGEIREVMADDDGETA